MPQQSDQTAVATAVIGTSAVVVGQYALIILAALFGAFVALSREDTETRSHGAAFIFRAVSISTFTSLFLAGLAYNKWPWLAQMPAHAVLMLVAFWVAFVGDGWFRVKDWAIERLRGKP